MTTFQATSSPAWRADGDVLEEDVEPVAGGVREHSVVAPVDALLAVLEPVDNSPESEREQARRRLRRHRAAATALLADVLGARSDAESAMTELLEDRSLPHLTSQQLRMLHEVYDDVVALARAEY